MCAVLQSVGGAQQQPPLADFDGTRALGVAVCVRFTMCAADWTPSVKQRLLLHCSSMTPALIMCVAVMHYTEQHRVDLQGHRVLPGLIDAHIHVASFGKYMTCVDLT